MSNPRIVHILLRVSIATVFLYAAGAAMITPDNWIGYIPQVIENFIPLPLALMGFSLFQVALSVWLLSGWKTLFSASLAALTLLAIIVANWTQVDILFRDFAIFFGAIALVIGSREDRKE